MSNDPTNLPSLNLPLEHDSSSISEFERHALSRDNYGTQYFETGMTSSYIEQDRLNQTINAWRGFESYA